MRRLAPADELAEIRAEITRLHARAEQIEAALIRNPAQRNHGASHVAEVTETRQTEFDPALLPDTLRTDPQFQREVVRHDVVLVPAKPQSEPLRPGWPIRRTAEQSLPLTMPSPLTLPLH
ncbi:MAG: hypothetical protein CFE34_08615 [Rhodobacteraceae bacterium PARR1]|nr:MAG: hypothetical protein CFE34_08615 [Rhodobacteraceae bacterium PARR1]